MRAGDIERERERKKRKSKREGERGGKSERGVERESE